MVLRVRDEGESQCRSVMARIRIAPPIRGNITRRESEQTSLGCLGTPETAEPVKEVLQMTAVPYTWRSRDGEPAGATFHLRVNRLQFSNVQSAGASDGRVP